MDQEHTRAQLAKIEKHLAQLVGVQKIHHVTPAQFLAHAARELSKAAKEPFEKSRTRLASLYKSVLYVSDAIEDAESDAIKVPVFVVEQTTFDEQESQTYTPEKAAAAGAGTNKDGKSFFANDTLGKAIEAGIASLQEAMGELVKAKGGDDEEEEGDEAKAKKAKPPPFPPPPPKKKPEGEEDAPKDAKKVAKSVEWPDDMNDPTFVEKGEKKPLDWGEDAQE